MQFYTYNWLHIPTGTGGSKSMQFTDREAFLSFLNRCNCTLPGKWQYWEGVSNGVTVDGPRQDDAQRSREARPSLDGARSRNQN